LFFAWILLFGFTFFGGKKSNTVQEEA